MRSKCLQLNAISDVFEGFLIKDRNDQFASEGHVHFKEKLLPYIEAGEPIEFVLAGFPCKSPNFVEKSFGVMPDYGEVVALKRIEELSRSVASVYAPGCQIILISDGFTFNDIVGVPDAVCDAYNKSLRSIAGLHAVVWKELSDFFPHADTAEKLRKALIKNASLPCKGIEDLKRRALCNLELSTAHDKLCGYLYNDMRLHRQDGQSDDEYLSALGQKAYEMMYRGMALNALIEQHFPDAVRLSVHQYSNAGPKFTLGFVAGATKVLQPWHSVPVLRRSGTVELVPNACVDKEAHALLTSDGAPWLYLELDKPSDGQFTYTLVKKPSFGVEISSTGNTALESLSADFMQSIVRQFGFVCIRDSDFKEMEELTRYSQRFGEIYHWKFGAVHVVKPADKPDGFVHSLEKTPLHWDLSMLPLDHEKVKDNEWFAASLFMLYCKQPPQPGEGCTTLVDGRLVLDMIAPERKTQWSRMTLTYDTRMTYFGGVPRTYPLIYRHPETGEQILRYQEGSDSELQKFSVSVDGVSASESSLLTHEIDRLIYDEQCMIAHDWRAGDLLIVDNWLTLHGRSAMSPSSKSRELWRVQVY